MSASVPWKYVSPLHDSIMEQRAGFLACLCKDEVPSRYLLTLYCFPAHLRSKLISDISSTYFVNMQGEGTSQIPLSNGDEILVSLSDGFEVHGEWSTEDIVLTFFDHKPFRLKLRISIRDRRSLQVDFLKRGKEQKNSVLACSVPIMSRSPVQVSGPATFDFEEGSENISECVTELPHHLEPEPYSSEKRQEREVEDEEYGKASGFKFEKSIADRTIHGEEW